MDARQKAANPSQHLKVVQLRHAPAAAIGADREGKTAMRDAGAAASGAYGGHLGGGQFGGKRVFFEDLRLAPALWAVKQPPRAGRLPA